MPVPTNKTTFTPKLKVSVANSSEKSEVTTDSTVQQTEMTPMNQPDAEAAVAGSARSQTPST